MFPFHKQHDSMQCGITYLQMICKYYGKEYSLESLSRYCFATTEGVSLLGISEAANKLALHTICGRVTMEQLPQAPLPCILHWRQNHFVILYKVKNKKKFYIADPGKRLITYTEKEFKNHWTSTQSKGEEKGIAMFIQPAPAFYELSGETTNRKCSFKFLFGYIKQYRRYFGQIILGALTGCLLQLIFPFLTQAIVDIGITHQNLGIIYLILLGQLLLTISRTSVDFICRWILLHISMQINNSVGFVKMLMRCILNHIFFLLDSKFFAKIVCYTINFSNFSLSEHSNNRLNIIIKYYKFTLPLLYS